MSALSMRDTEPMTPEEVLEVFMVTHHVECSLEEVEHYSPISFDMTVADWRSDMDYVGHNQLGLAFNEWFQTDFTLTQWSQVFHPEKKKTLRGACELIASKAVKPKYHPVTILGSSCVSAGVFLSLREYLKQSGLDVSEVRPSTPLSCYFDSPDYRSQFINALIRIHPRLFMNFRYDRTPDKALNAAVLAVVFSVILLVIPLPLTALTGFLLLVLTIPLLLFSILRHCVFRRKFPTFTGIKGIDTFRDISPAIVNYDALPPVTLDF